MSLTVQRVGGKSSFNLTERLTWRCLVAAAALAAAPAAGAAEISTLAHAGYGCCASGAEQDQAGATIGVHSQAEAHYAGESFGRPTTGEAYARADLVTGELGVSASSVYFGEASALATYAERLNFTIGGAGANDVTPIVVLLKWHGDLTSGLSPESGTSTAFYNFTLFQGIFNATVALDGISSNGGLANFRTQVVGQWLSQLETNDVPGTYIFALSYGLIGANPVIDVRSRMGVGASLTSFADAYNSASVNFILPENVSFTSTSGVYLSQARPILSSPTPEPSAWAMMILGFASTGSVLRKGRRSDRAC